ncbi:hypothetical protein JD76_04544 [Micromonospora endolithica]|nr:hypothetical protein JD76_04544 [Micromonospora endolithica]
MPRWQQWTLLVTMSLVFLSQVGTGFDRPLNIIAGVGAAGLALFCAAALVVGRRRR